MKIAIADKLLEGVTLTHQEALQDFAIGLYSEGKVTLGRAAEVASSSQTEFLQELGRRHIPIHYDVQDLKADILMVKEH